jgi:probable phosphoglycerate mutase
MHDVELWLVRHGETARSARRELAGWADPSLTRRGEREARALRSVLDGAAFTSVWSSDLVRTVTTARLAHGEPRQDRRLRELDFGTLEGRRWTELGERRHRQLLSFRSFAAPEGESVDDLRARLVSFLDELPPGRHLLFTHGGPIRVLVRDLGVDRFVPTGTVVIMSWTRQALIRVLELE